MQIIIITIIIIFKVCKIIAFQPKGTVPEYTFDNVCRITQVIANTWVILQSDMKFLNHIDDQIG